MTSETNGMKTMADEPCKDWKDPCPYDGPQHDFEPLPDIARTARYALCRKCGVLR